MGKDKIFFEGESLLVLRFFLVGGDLADFWLVGGGCQIPNSQVLISHDSLCILVNLKLLI